jgi:tRNA 2-thiocytidine biosynthesis protein TtcA
MGAPAVGEAVARLERRLEARLGQAIGDFGLIQPGDRILVGVSGGKDSWVLLHLLRRLQRRAPVRFELVALSIDQGFPGFRADVIEDYLAREGYVYEMRHARVALTVREKLAPGDTFCSLCARLRRGAIYRFADELHCRTVALGHHADDAVETLLLNLFFSGRIKGMPARFAARNGRHVVIRPLIYLWEEEVAEYARALGFPVVCCGCPGCLDPTLERHRLKRLLRELERAHPGLKRNLLAGLARVDAESLLLPTRARRGAPDGPARLPALAATLAALAPPPAGAADPEGPARE